ncbi:MAG TPA: PA2778 family cysteine peptidase [Rhodocyclaceae bacterium]
MTSCRLRDVRRLAGVLAAAVALGGCSMMLPQTTALQDHRPAQLPDRVALDGVPFVPQDENLCGPAALKMAMASADTEVMLGDLKREVFVPGRQGSLQAEMLAAPRRHGLVSYQLAPRLEDVLREVSTGTPVIVLQDYGVWPVKVWHYAVVVGYDYPKHEVVLNSGLKQGMRMPIAVLEYLWKQSDYWAMVAVPPQRIPATAHEAAYVDAVAALEKAGGLKPARIAYQTALDRWPDDLKATVGLANAAYELGDLAQAEAVLRPAVERHPDSAILLNNLAQVLSDLKRDPEALKVIDRAAALGGDFSDAVQQTRRHIVARMQSAATAVKN